MASFINKHKILYLKQYGFRVNLSTTFALIDAIDQIKESIDNKEHVLGLFLDVEKAFNCVNHKILLHKLDHYGFRGHILKLLSSYVSDRSQFTRINNVNSATNIINYGVPQGSILGPLLFLLYVNDIHASIIDEIILFADDTAIFIKNKNLAELITHSTNTVKLIHEWFKANKLSVSFNKSNFIVFSSSRINSDEINNIPYGEYTIPRVPHSKYIGMIIDEKLSWNLHINKQIIAPLMKYFGVFYNIRKHLNNKLMRTAYFSCIYSKIQYGIEVYGNCSKTLSTKLQILQNKLLRTLMGKSRYHSSSELHKELNILKINDALKLTTLAFVYKCLNNDTTEYFHNYFTNNEHSYNTRRRHDIAKHKVRTSLGQSTTHYQGASLWNDLQNCDKTANNVMQFKHTIRDSYIRHY
jgi:hypothetical protein